MVTTERRNAVGVVDRPGGDVGRWIASVVCLVAALLWTVMTAAAQAVSVEIKPEANFGRIIVSFADKNILPAYTVNTDNGVLVLHFEDPVEIDVSRVSSMLSKFVMIARADPEGRGARFALTRGTRVNTMEAGPKLFLDFLPADWAGPPPRLPDEIIAELARRAEDAARRAREAEMLKVAGSKAAKLDLTVARAPTFSRLTFHWNVPFEADFQRQDSGVSVRFNRKAKVDLSTVRMDMPPYLDDISTESDDDGITVLLSVQPSADVRAFKDENTYVVDIQGHVDPAALRPHDAIVHAATRDGSEAPPTATEEVHAPGVEDTTPVVPAGHAAEGHGATPAAEGHGAPAPAEGHGAAPAADGHGTAASHAADVGHEVPAEGGLAVLPPVPEAHDAAADSHAAPGGHAAPDAHEAPHATTAADATAEEYAAPSSARVKPTGGQLAELPDGGDEHALADGTIRVEAKRIGSATRVVFPYHGEIGAALFSRGPAVWLVFDDPSPIDAAPLQDALAGYARSIEPMKIGGEAQAIRIEMAEPLLATLNPEGTFWVVTIGDMVMAPTRPLPIKRSIAGDGAAALEIPFGPVSAMHHITDPASGDEVLVITGRGQPRGLIKPQTFAEVEALSSAHGLAFLPKVDDLQVKSEGELVSLRRPGGLSISTDTAPKRAAVLDLPASIGSSLGGRPGFVDFADTEAGDAADFWHKRHDLMGQVSQAREKSDRVDRWYKLAKFNLANGLGSEALGILRLIGSIAPEEETSQRMAVLRAGASLLMHRPTEALSMLDRPELADSPYAAVWRTIADVDLGRHTDARKQMPRAEEVIGSFPRVIQRRFMLASVATALELNDYAKARTLLSEIDPKALRPDELAELDLLNARAIDADGHAGDAIGILSNVVRTGRGPVAAEATYRLVLLQRREGLITLDQALDRLEQLAVAWRGDDIELNTLRTLGQYSIEKGNYRRAFEVMRSAMQIDPNAQTTRLMQDEMQAAFASLYLDGKADEMKPTEALALYYDFRELTPNGRRGDAMVRKLAERLVDVDLLPQAQQLLTYQVENRLRGAARAQVAADLALVYLLDQRPDRALLILSRTRQSELPAGIERQRRSVEARALAETGKPDLALDLLKPLRGGDIERLRADILWENDRYEDAGDQYERMLGGRWNEPLPLSDLEQMQVLKAGISFTLAGDRLSLDRLRAKYSKKMAETANGAAFEAVTSRMQVAGGSFQEVVKSIANVGTLQAFLDDYRKRYLELGDPNRPALIENGTAVPLGAGGGTSAENTAAPTAPPAAG
ncbi:tetratricopeptide repeat protein [Oharaeibacter diazotrophicus]|uniref:Tetratricopeptide (TPR) repeat protein n=1 Tax=Oharaeibacter diazotrophicus TaxID=1920512 RepID=A0A4R6RM47_9HYPH|nr:hypothetical protein [Oharaeibacter diazotrophicus]TDP87630.1 tetratricopeptide (TPR) repeat protein [Oharaeibacter diazotrophicus]BBE74787.1 hypothetical protein OHA_1_04424 [Pleomorphomonas sp. SM30]